MTHQARSNRTRGENSHRLSSARRKLHRDIDPQGLLSPLIVQQHIDAQLCPFCGAGPFRLLGSHTNRAHAVTANELKRMAGLTVGASTAGADLAQVKRERAVKNDFGSEAHRISPESRRRQRENLARWHAENPMTESEKAAAVARLNSAEAVAKRDAVRVARLLPHGTVASYKRGCRCAACFKAKQMTRVRTGRKQGQGRALTWDQVATIRSRRAAGETIRALASGFDVSEKVVSDVVNNRGAYAK